MSQTYTFSSSEEAKEFAAIQRLDGKLAEIQVRDEQYVVVVWSGEGS